MRVAQIRGSNVIHECQVRRLYPGSSRETFKITTCGLHVSRGMHALHLPSWHVYELKSLKGVDDVRPCKKCFFGRLAKTRGAVSPRSEPGRGAA